MKAVFLSFILLVLSGSAIAATQEKPDEEFRKQLKEAIADAGDSFEDRFDAEVWLLEQATRLKKRVKEIPQEEQLTILRLVHQESSRYGFDPLMILSLITVESNFDRFAISSAGARGLMQIMPFWIEEIGKPDDNLFDIPTNLKYGCAILSIYLKREKGDLTKALARYNGSVGKTWYPQRVYKAKRNIWRE
jgi:soluble lytic murein transglycosylase-like protein